MARSSPFGVTPPNLTELDYAQHFAAWFPPPRAMGLLPGMPMSHFLATAGGARPEPPSQLQRSFPPPLRHMPSDSGESDDSFEEDQQLSEWRARLRTLMVPMGLQQQHQSPANPLHQHQHATSRGMRSQAPPPVSRPSNPFEQASNEKQFRSKIVCELHCKSCNTDVCSRGMKAMLLADAQVEVYSTDTPPPG